MHQTLKETSHFFWGYHFVCLALAFVILTDGMFLQSGQGSCDENGQEEVTESCECVNGPLLGADWTD